MTALIIILAIIILLLLLPVGVDAAFAEGVLSLKVKAGPVKVRILPAKPKKHGEKPEEKKPKKPKRKKEKPAKPKRKLTFEDIKGIARLALRALSRLRRMLSIDVLMLHLRVGGDDPYETVVRYGTINAALGAGLPYLHRAFKIRKQDIQTAIDFAGDKTSADARFEGSYRIWEILLIAVCAGASFIVWTLRRRKRARAEEKARKAQEKEQDLNKQAKDEDKQVEKTA